MPNITYYYRLKQIDFDGKHELSIIVSAAITGSESVIISEFIPNPAIGNSKILITSPTDLQLDVNLYNPLGQEIQAGKLVLTAGVQTPFVVDASTLAAGNYVLLLRNDNLFVSRRLVVTTR
ncbi:MAG: T9SS type A sorting domain-containing protein [Chitinophagales bacterium]|nr:T9SS type A sorting domain-containing protein [Chitinophagales bacterium]